MPHVIVKTKMATINQYGQYAATATIRKGADERVVAVATKANIKILYEQQLTGAMATATVQAQ